MRPRCTHRAPAMGSSYNRGGASSSERESTASSSCPEGVLREIWTPKGVCHTKLMPTAVGQTISSSLYHLSPVWSLPPHLQQQGMIKITKLHPLEE